MGGFYEALSRDLAALMADCPLVSNLSNASALLYGALDQVNWAGFYLSRGEELLLGPFQGKPACLSIPLDRGVCRLAASRRETVVVSDVHAFPGHIACDGASRSEIVLPLIQEGRLVGVMDIDSPVLNRFTAKDARGLEKCARILQDLPGWEQLTVDNG